jgi:[acyl-carrier-protein] S-malonyltransferase
LEPSFVAGHSLGEYSALVAANALSLEDAVRLVALRGAAMQKAVPPDEGAMLAVMGGDERAVEALCDDARGADTLSPANYNCPGQIVIAGHKQAVERALLLTKERKLKGILLKVSAPFHCKLMAPAAARVADALRGLTLTAPAFPVIANVNAMPNQEAERIPELLIEQVCGAVRWEQSVRYLAAQGVTHALELGPGNVLAGLVKKTAPEIRVLSVGDTESLSQVEGFLAARE